MIEILSELAPAIGCFLIVLELGMFGLIIDMYRMLIGMKTKMGLCEACPQRSAPVSVPSSKRRVWRHYTKNGKEVNPYV